MLICNKHFYRSSVWNLFCLGLMVDYDAVFCIIHLWTPALQWRHNERDGVQNQPHECLLNRLFRRRSKKASERRAIGLCVGNSPVTGEFPSQRANNAEKVSIWLRHHESQYSERSVFWLPVSPWRHEKNPFQFCRFPISQWTRILNAIY